MYTYVYKHAIIYNFIKVLFKKVSPYYTVIIYSNVALIFAN